MRRDERGGDPLDGRAGRPGDQPEPAPGHVTPVLTADWLQGGVSAGGRDRMTGDSIALLSAALSGVMQVSLLVLYSSLLTEPRDKGENTLMGNFTIPISPIESAQAGNFI